MCVSYRCQQLESLKLSGSEFYTDRPAYEESHRPSGLPPIPIPFLVVREYFHVNFPHTNSSYM